MKRDLVEQVVDDITKAIIDAEYQEGEALPPEGDLASRLNVSRLTAREAVRILKDRGILEVVQGRGTFVAPRAQWNDLSTLVACALHDSSPRDVGLRLTELRRMIEVGAAGLAARNRSEADLAALASHIAAMEAADETDDVSRHIEEDLAFHRRILLASANPFIPVVMSPLEKALHESRVVTASHPEVRKRAQNHHRTILDALRIRDEEAAKDAMRAHMTQTRLDLVQNTDS